MPSLSFHFWPSAKPRHALLDQEARDLALGGRGIHHEGVAERVLVAAAVGDEGLAAVDHVDVAVALGARAHGEHVGADLGLGHAQAARATRRSRPSAARGASALRCRSPPRSARTGCRARAPRARSPGRRWRAPPAAGRRRWHRGRRRRTRRGSVMPSRPSAPACRKSAWLKRSSRSCSAACGSTSRATNSRSVPASSACSGVGASRSKLRQSDSDMRRESSRVAGLRGQVLRDVGLDRAALGSWRRLEDEAGIGDEVVRGLGPRLDQPGARQLEGHLELGAEIHRLGAAHQAAVLGEREHRALPLAPCAPEPDRQVRGHAQAAARDRLERLLEEPDTARAVRRAARSRRPRGDPPARAGPCRTAGSAAWRRSSAPPAAPPAGDPPECTARASARRARGSPSTPPARRSRSPCGPGSRARAARRLRGGRATGSGGASRREQHRRAWRGVSDRGRPAVEIRRRKTETRARAGGARTRRLAAGAAIRDRGGLRDRLGGTAPAGGAPEAEALRRFRSFLLLALTPGRGGDAVARGAPYRRAPCAAPDRGLARSRGAGGWRRPGAPCARRLTPLLERFVLALRETGRARRASGAPVAGQRRAVSAAIDRVGDAFFAIDAETGADRRREPGGGGAPGHDARSLARRGGDGVGTGGCARAVVGAARRGERGLRAAPLPHLLAGCGRAAARRGRHRHALRHPLPHARPRPGARP